MNSDDPQLLAFDPAEIAKRQEESKTFFVPPCGLNFIDDHYGPRPGNLHGLLGSTGRGKSTLTQSLIAEWGKKSKLLLYITEETPERLELKLSLKDEDMTYLSPKLFVLHEQQAQKEWDISKPSIFLNLIRDKIIQTEARVFICDNLTTSIAYQDLRNCNLILQGFRKIAQELNVAFFIVCHTKKGITETSKGLIMPDDVRGSAQLPMTCDYFYCFHRIRKTVQFGQPIDSSFIYLAKSRDYPTQDNLYKLSFDVKTQKYFKDTLVSFQIFKSFLKERDKI